MTKTMMINEMLDANYEPAYKCANWIFKRYGICEEAKKAAFRQLKYHTAGTHVVEKLYFSFKNPLTK